LEWFVFVVFTLVLIAVAAKPGVRVRRGSAAHLSTKAELADHLMGPGSSLHHGMAEAYDWLDAVHRFFLGIRGWRCHRTKRSSDWASIEESRVCLLALPFAGFGFFPRRGSEIAWVKKATHPPQLFRLGARSGGPTHFPRFAWSGKAPARDVLGCSL